MRVQRALAAWGPVALYLGLVSFVSHQPGSSLPDAAPDWVLHSVEFAGLALLSARGVVRSGRSLSIAAALWILACCAAAGVLDELHQSFVPGRDPSIRDAIVDTAGAALALAGTLVVRRVRGEGHDTTRIRATAPEVTLLGRPGCHLCEEAEAVLESVLPEFGARLVKVDVDGEPELKRRFGEQIPVVLVDGRKIAKHRVRADRLRRALEATYARRAS